MTSFQGNETALHQLTADCMLNTTDVLLISCLLIGLATYFLLAAFMLDTKIGRYFISIAETIDLCRPGSTIASIFSTACRMIESVASYLSRKKPEGAIVPGVHPVLDFLRSEETAPSCASPIRSPQRSCSAQCTSRTFERPLLVLRPSKHAQQTLATARSPPVAAARVHSLPNHHPEFLSKTHVLQ